MSSEKIEKILKSYPPVEGRPGYVWFSRANNQIVHIDILRQAYEESFKVGEINKEQQDGES